MDDAEMLGLFVQESADNLAALETELLALGSDPRDATRLHRIFRAVHSVKGTAGFFGLTAITALAHVMESVMALVRDGRMDAAPALVNDLLAGTDKLKAMIADPARSAEIPTDSERAALQSLLQFVPASGAAPPAPALPANLNAFKLDAELIRAALRDGHHIYIINLCLQADIEAAGQTPLHYLREIGELGTLIHTALDLGDIGGLNDEAPADLVCSILFAAAMEPDLLIGAFGIPPNQLTQLSTDFFTNWEKSQPTLVAR